jgi:hypothetical protein
MVLLTEETGLSYFCLGLKITPLWFGLKLPEFLHKDQLKENKYIYIKALKITNSNKKIRSTI